MSKAERYTNFDGMCWPIPDEHTGHESVEGRLRYSPETLSRQDMLYAASVIRAYSSLIYQTISDRNVAVDQIRKAAKWQLLFRKLHEED